ncbi:MAG: hypothetical protein KatS3mg006_0198 [Pyrinomonadaceae bacterium]|nr:MAG: hypothetical protein KatS3mg006_0198 [Pyrinomonadaceae bacterium]
MKVLNINARKLNQKTQKSWQAELITQNEKFILLSGQFEKEIWHPHLNVIRRGTISYEFFWWEKWYSIFRFHEPDGKFKIFYCNINLPPIVSDNTLDYVDLDIDIIVREDMSYKILDLEEFQQNSLKFSYPEEIVKKCFKSLCELQAMINARSFPFNLPLDLPLTGLILQRYQTQP